MEKTEFAVKAPKILIDMWRRGIEATESGYKTWRKIHNLENEN